MISERQRVAPGLVADLFKARCEGEPGPQQLAAMAERYRMPVGEVFATASFYHFLHLPAARYELLFIDHITDEHMGVKALAARLAEQLFVEIGRVSPDKRVFIGWTSCAGLSDQAPSALINGRPAPRLTAQRIDNIAQLILHDIPVEAWPSEWFEVDNPIYRSGPMLEQACEHEPAKALARAVALGPQQVIETIAESGLRGRGGAGFPTATKWRLCREASAPEGRRVLICNADEGEPGTFKDRFLLTNHPELIFEGMAIAAYAIGAEEAILYLRAEYRYLLSRLQEALQRFERAAATFWPGVISIALGAGAYVCGEESALIESLEGKPGRPRVRPPFPVTRGYCGLPTVVNNVETLAAAALILSKGASWWRSFGTEKTTGPKLFSISGDVAQAGIYEWPSGVTLGEVLKAAGAKAPLAVQVSGPSGTLVRVTPETLQRRLAYEDLPCAGAVIVFDAARDPVQIVAHFARFFARESCGFCTPCRVGTQMIQRTLEKVVAGYATRYDLEQLAPVLEAMRTASNCGFGLSAGNPVRDLITSFRAELEARLQSYDFIPSFSLDDELAATRQLARRDDPHAHLAQFEHEAF